MDFGWYGGFRLCLESCGTHKFVWAGVSTFSFLDEKFEIGVLLLHLRSWVICSLWFKKMMP